MNTDQYLITRLRESMSLRDKLKAAQQVVDLANSSGYLPAVQEGLSTPAKRKSIARSALRGAALGVGALGAGALGATALARSGLLYAAYRGARATGKTFRDSVKAARTWGQNEMLPLGYVLARDLPNVVRYAPKAAGVGAVLGANYRLYKGFSDKRRKKQMESTNQCFGRLLEIEDGAHRLRKWYKNRQEKKRQVESLRVLGNLREMSPQRAAWAAETAMKAYKNPHIPALRKGLRKSRYPSTLYSMANKFARYARKKETMMDTLYNPVKLPSFVGSAYRSGA